MSEIFPTKLYIMLEAAIPNNFQHIVSWTYHGRSFKVHDTKAFAEHVLPRYFSGQTRYKSFLRQLNFYKFKRVSDGEEKGAYYHNLFARGRRIQCQFIKREPRWRPQFSKQKYNDIQEMDHVGPRKHETEKNEEKIHTTVGLPSPDSATASKAEAVIIPTTSEKSPSSAEAKIISNKGKEIDADMNVQASDNMMSAVSRLNSTQNFSKCRQKADRTKTAGAGAFVEDSLFMSSCSLLLLPSSQHGDEQYDGTSTTKITKDDILDEIIRTFR